jgi:F-type H+-transporting ATPase subunit gamma
MTRRHELEQHLHGLREIREILNCMKSLAYMETRKLLHRLENQRQVLQAIKRAAADFLSFHPYSLPEAAERTPVYILVGTERGFCGDFNEQVKAHLEAQLNGEPSSAAARLILVGSRLSGQFTEDPRVSATIQGADTAEEIEMALARITDTLSEQHPRLGPLSLTAVFCDSDLGETASESLLPPFREFIAAKSPFPFPPVLNLEPPDFLLELANAYLIAALNQILHTSLLAENHRRLQHLEGAVQYLDKQIEALRRTRNQLRQEEIIEEIEVILMNASTPEHGTGTEAPFPGRAGGTTKG